ncbi:hypothetical protein BT93_C0862 [Corymbia citriodora subsp. variegata]|nr:hypothetical protein BT93_C0862 [Corymbia citriodora subsp. variegata]
MSWDLNFLGQCPDLSTYRGCNLECYYLILASLVFFFLGFISVRFLCMEIFSHILFFLGRYRLGFSCALRFPPHEGNNYKQVVMRTSVQRNEEDAITVASDLLTVTETNSGGSSLSLTEIDNGASDLTVAATGNRYDVFLSFRGIDTRKGFTDHLYTRLVDAGIHVFKDDDELCQGKRIGPDLLAAIKNSKILIPIISLNYGSSCWCLNELVQVMECHDSNMGHLVLPIFYKVEPTHVRHQIGSFGDAFRMHERHSDQTILEKWKQALNEVSSLKGWEANGYEGKLVKSIVQKVLSELKKEFELVVPDNLVGIDSHVKNVMEFLDNNSSATLFVGIHGMGGIGKTTLAKTIYNKLSSKFECCSFIADIRESCKRNGLEYLQNKLIFDILKQKNQVYNTDEGTRFLSSKLEDKKVLILLDDVDDDDQLKALAGNYNWFSPGSKILITTRNKAILDNAVVDYNYEHEEMDDDQSLILFSRHAFRKNSPPSEFKDLACEVVSTTGGLPLALEVLGSLFCGKRPTQWRGTIKKLNKVPHKKVQQKLRISYDGTEKIRAIYLRKGISEDFGGTPDHSGNIHTSGQFENLTRLRFLHVSGAHFSGDFKNSIEELRWLQWQNCPLTFEAKNFHLKELVALDLSKSKISDKWQGWNSIMVR